MFFLKDCWPHFHQIKNREKDNRKKVSPQKNTVHGLPLTLPHRLTQNQYVKPSKVDTELHFSANQPQMPGQLQHSPLTSLSLLKGSWKREKSGKSRNCWSGRGKGPVSPSYRAPNAFNPSSRAGLHLHSVSPPDHCVQGLHSGISLLLSSATLHLSCS